MALAVSFVLTAVLTVPVARLAVRLGIVDRPGPLKVQAHPVPYLGGLAVLAGVIGPTLAARPSLALPLAAATLLGLADDVSDLPARVRLLAEVGIGLGVAATVGVTAPWALGVVAATVLLVNAVNLLDGLDGLASGVALASTVGFAVILDGDARTVSLALAGALSGFLLWNRPPARIYLGDAGSYLIGTTLAVLLARTVADGVDVSARVAAVLLVGVAVGDTTVAVVRRARARRPLFEGDRGHVYDQLVGRGWPAPRAVLACVAAQGALALVAAVVAERSTAVAVLAASITVAVVGVWALGAFTGAAGRPPDPTPSAQ